MNLNEAAEIVRDSGNAMNSIESSQRYVDACEVLGDAMLAELDPSPLSQEWLDAMTDSCGIIINGETFSPKTKGDLATILRVTRRDTK